jgi:hypothetical protein
MCFWSTEVNIRAGFKSTGIYPFDPSTFSIPDFDPIDYEEYENLTASKNCIPSIIDYIP